MSRAGAAYRAFDRFQQRHGWLGFPLAVRQKYSDDQGGYLAATIAYYGFLSFFPLLLVLTTILGFLLHSYPGLEHQIVNSALAQIPIVGGEIQRHTLTGSGIALGLGLAAALWAGIRIFLAAENAMNHLWGVPFKRRPDPFRGRGRALLLLLALGGAALVSTALGTLGTVGDRFGIAWKIAAAILSTAVDFGLFWFAFRELTAAEVDWGEVRTGAAIAAVLYEGLQLGGGYYVNHVLRSASETYGTFALVIGLISWMYLAAHITLLAAEANVVANRRLWPRSFSVIVEEPSTSADRRALTQRSRVEERRQDQRIEVEFGEPDQRG